MKKLIEKILEKREVIETFFLKWRRIALVAILIICQLNNICAIWTTNLNWAHQLNTTFWMIIGTTLLVIKSGWLKPFLFSLKMKRRLPFWRNDGGRSNYFNGKANDCAVRGIAIATGMDYLEVYLGLTKAIQDNVNIDLDGTNPRIIKKYLENLGWKYYSFHGKGGKINKNNPNVPKKGIYILDTPGHVTCIVDGFIQDRFNSSELELCGYFYKEEP